MVAQVDIARAFDQPEPLSVRGEWLALRVTAQYERRLQTFLGQRDLTAFIPLIQKKKSYPSGHKEWEAPMYPGYLFACTGGFDGDAFAKIFYATKEFIGERHRVHTIVREKNQKGLVRELQEMYEKMCAGESTENCDDGLVGKMCDVVHGPFKRHVVHVASANHNGTMNCEFEFMGKPRPFITEAYNLVPIVN